MSWFKREKDNIHTSTEDKIEPPDGLWTKCPECNTPSLSRALEEVQHVCPDCNYHFRIGSKDYFNLLFDDKKWKELNGNLTSADPLKFVDSKSYPDRIKATQIKTGMLDAAKNGFGKIHKQDWTISCMDFEFIGGSMGSVVGEKISLGIDHAIAKKTPFMVISKSGGARMMEGALSLMQMAKVSAKLNLLSRAKLPYFSLMTDPTTGGVTASYAMLGDFNLAEPKALIGFAGPRVIRETIGKDLPDGFQRAEFLLEKGFIDQIVDRRQLKDKLAALYSFVKV